MRATMQSLNRLDTHSFSRKNLEISRERAYQFQYVWRLHPEFRTGVLIWIRILFQYLGFIPKKVVLLFLLKWDNTSLCECALISDLDSHARSRYDFAIINRRNGSSVCFFKMLTFDVSSCLSRQREGSWMHYLWWRHCCYMEPSSSLALDATVVIMGLPESGLKESALRLLSLQKSHKNMSPLGVMSMIFTRNSHNT